MSIHRQLSSWAGSRIGHAFDRSLDRDRPWSLPFGMWPLLPKGLRRWISYRVLRPGEVRAQQALRDGHPLARLQLPASNGWSLSSVTRIYLHHLLRRKQPRSIVEFGSGLSTIIFADDAARRFDAEGDGPVILSIEHDAGWMEETRGRLERLGLSGLVRFVHAPLEEREVFGAVQWIYRVPDGAFDSVAGEAGFDLCLIDGPPGVDGRQDRRACLPLIARHLAEDAVVLLDDAFRRGERAAWRQWRGWYPGALRGSRIMLTPRGLALGTWKPARPA